jgi:hypothetical protein
LEFTDRAIPALDVAVLYQTLHGKIICYTAYDSGFTKVSVASETVTNSAMSLYAEYSTASLS